MRALVGLFFMRKTKKTQWLHSKGTLIIIPQNGASPTSRPFANNNKRKNNRSSRNTRGVGGLHNGGQGDGRFGFYFIFPREKVVIRELERGVVGGWFFPPSSPPLVSNPREKRWPKKAKKKTFTPLPFLPPLVHPSVPQKKTRQKWFPLFFPDHD